MSELPEGTVTLLFADVEGSTRHLLRLGDRYAEALQLQNAVLQDAVQRFNGRLVDTRGDASFAAFGAAQDAIQAAIAAQRSLAVQPWPDGEPFRVRIGLHTGEPIKEADDFFGQAVILAARIAAQAGGGEILASSLIRELAESSGEFTFGEARQVTLKGLRGPRAVSPVTW